MVTAQGSEPERSGLGSAIAFLCDFWEATSPLQASVSHLCAVRVIMLVVIPLAGCGGAGGHCSYGHCYIVNGEGLTL